MRRLALWLTLAVALFSSGCGFQLRGSADYPAGSIYIEDNNATLMAYTLTQRLKAAGVTVPEKATAADLVLTLSNEEVDRRVLSVSAITGKLEEVELNYRLRFALSYPDGTPVIEPQLISLLRDYSFEETAVLAKGEEEKVLREELFRDALAQITRRLQMVRVAERVETVESVESEDSEEEEADE